MAVKGLRTAGVTEIQKRFRKPVAWLRRRWRRALICAVDRRVTSCCARMRSCVTASSCRANNCQRCELTWASSDSTPSRSSSTRWRRCTCNATPRSDVTLAGARESAWSAAAGPLPTDRHFDLVATRASHRVAAVVPVFFFVTPNLLTTDLLLIGGQD